MSNIDLDSPSTNPTQTRHFNDIVAGIVSRRGFMKRGLGLGAVGFMGASLAACGGGSDDDTVTPEPTPTPTPTPPKTMLGFTQVAANTGDAITLPTGYSHQVFCAWGDPLFPQSPAWQPNASNDGAAQALQFGDNHDGMHFFPLAEGNSAEGLLVMNHEYLNDEFFYAKGIEPGVEGKWTLDNVRKGQHAHGITVAHVKLEGGQWKVVIPSRYNRRLHLNSPMVLTGPAAGHRLLQTSADPSGTSVLGTVNNCGNGFTPWGTYLTCEENFNGYFGTLSGADSRDAQQRRYGLSAQRSGYKWEDFDARFDYVKEPNESNRFGWIVEIDPFDPSSAPKKRTALGRFKHENAAATFANDNRVVVYMGDDQANDYVYKFISDNKFDAATPALNRNLLETGTLYVARFGDGPTKNDMMGAGEWIPLVLATRTTDGRTLGDLFADMGELLVKTRLAADAVGATPMDRPEWVNVHPETREPYLTLTNNSGRREGNTDDANPRANNVYGQIIRWREENGDPAALAFTWDLFVLAGNPVVGTGLNKGSDNVNADNMFNSPDGLAFDNDGRLWIQTDGSFANTGAYAGMGNNQMLVADPATREIRRFLVGPSGCEITGITWTPDQKYVFINVQHPGEYGSHPRKPAAAPQDDPLAFSQWPTREGGRPRSATVVIWKNDGGVVGT
ncbi:PhoX family phosphatase [Achromobacter sp. GG226]|uniref:PhoX family protein n=1 Tax=Verticiella alkaliphila TaxID=2779529 RepID=UPI001C0C505F|nr:PhoX family phosphatase [Verticiella sp. GG226]MBU4610855.1 PhoX family phosphatase [Verticiella sp. GG226]